ncbi:hypothetical protein ACRAWF_00405 [Streptomyces sp. L7]
MTLVEPGFFRTDFLDPASLNSDIDVIDDYAPTAGAMRDAVPSLNHAQPGDPVKAAHAIVEIAATPEPPCASRSEPTPCKPSTPSWTPSARRWTPGGTWTPLHRPRLGHRA